MILLKVKFKINHFVTNVSNVANISKTRARNCVCKGVWQKKNTPRHILSHIFGSDTKVSNRLTPFSNILFTFKHLED